jgi:diguanylate cyclase (GGDEF)-like protein
LCLFDRAIENRYGLDTTIPSRIRMVLGLNKGKLADVMYFNTLDMLPQEFLYLKKRRDLIFLPLFSGNDYYGYIVLETGEANENIFENLRELVSNTLKSQSLFNELSEAKEKLDSAVIELKKYNSELRDISVNDELTHLYNRRGFYLNGEKYLKYAKLASESFTVFFGDIDGLKKINDSYGHQEGDQAIRVISEVLKKSFRSNDIVARIGGDEFTALALNLSWENEINAILKRIDYYFDEYNSTSGKPYKISVSFGYACYFPSSEKTFDELIREADRKLYEKKKNKRLPW